MAVEIKMIPGRRGILVPIGTLQQSTLIDNAHARQLSVMLAAEGQTEPVIKWSKRAPNGDNMANGRHRVRAVALLGGEFIIADELDFPNLSAFYSAQITASAPHDELQAARIPELVRAIFMETEWADKIDEVEAFRMPQTINQRRKSISLVKRGLTRDQQERLAYWINVESDGWTLTPGRVASILMLSRDTDPYLLSLVGTRPEEESPFTEPMLRKLVKVVPDRAGQLAVAEVALNQGLGEHDYTRLVEEFGRATSPSEMNTVLSREWKTRIELRRMAQPTVVDQATREREIAANEQYQIKDVVRKIDEAAESLPPIAELVKKYPHLLRRMRESLIGFAIAQAHFEGDDGKADILAALVEQLTILSRENEQLKTTNRDLLSRLEAGQRSGEINKLNESAKLERPS